MALQRYIGSGAKPRNYSKNVLKGTPPLSRNRLANLAVEPKGQASNTTIGVDRPVLQRIHHLKLLIVEVKAGQATRKYRIVKSAGPNNLVFQSVKDGKPMRDNNVLSRFIKPAARVLGLDLKEKFRDLLWLAHLDMTDVSEIRQLVNGAFADLRSIDVII